MEGLNESAERHMIVVVNDLQRYWRWSSMKTCDSLHMRADVRVATAACSDSYLREVDEGDWGLMAGFEDGGVTRSVKVMLTAQLSCWLRERRWRLVFVKSDSGKCESGDF